MSMQKNGSVNDENKKEMQKETEKVNDFSDSIDPPDGGWGWIIVIAAGLSNFCVLPVLQCFGLVFRDRFADLGITSSQTTTILNINCAVNACIGLANGPLFRKFSYRHVSLAGAMICAISITILSTTKTFTGALIFFSLLYGAGSGITMSSNALALNTYFKKKRRIAIGLSWTCTGMGPIVVPQVITLLMPIYGVQGTVLIFGGVAFNAVVCALLLQPVSWHVKKKQNIDNITSQETVKSEELTTAEKVTTEVIYKDCENAFQSRSLENIAENTRNSYGTLSVAKGKFGSQYLYYDDEEDGASGIDVMGPGTPMMSRANDGWFSRRNTSNTSIASRSSKKESSSRTPSRRSSVTLSRQSSLNRGTSVRTLNRQNSDTEKRKRFTAPLIIVKESCEHAEDSEHCKDPNCMNKTIERSIIPEEVETDQLLKVEFVEKTTKKSFVEALVIFFDLDLLRDLVYLNIMLGITFANFAEMNFALLTPFILGEYGFSKVQTATVMSTLAGFDVAARLTIPFIANFIGWQNRTFFLIGVCGLAIGRIVLAHVRDFGVTLAIAGFIGCGKALRTIFMALVIPSHVPLSRLPGATGIQLLTSGIVSLSLGPAVGWIRDLTSNYVLMLHCLNIFTYLTTISWIIELYYTGRKSKKAAEETEASNKLNKV